jgi:hypothetical protein
MDYDEAYTFLHYASAPLKTGLSDYSLPNNHLFHTFLVHIIYSLFGNYPWAIRLPAFIAGILLVPITYLAARMIFNKYSALLAAGYTASSEVLISYSNNARGYTIVSLLFLLLLACGIYLKEHRSTFVWILFVIISALGFYTIPTMVYAFGIVVMWIFLSIMFHDTHLPPKRLFRDLLVSMIAVFALTLLFYTPVMLTTGVKSIVGYEGFQAKPWPIFFRELAGSLPPLWNEWKAAIPPAITVFLVIGFFIAVICHRWMTAHRISLIIPILLWPLMILCFQRGVPFTRVWMFLLPPFFVFASAGLLFLIKPVEIMTKINISKIASVLTLLFLLFMSSYVVKNIWNIYHDPSRIDHISNYFIDNLHPGDIFGAFGYWATPIAYYFAKHDISVAYIGGDWALTCWQLLQTNKNPNSYQSGKLEPSSFPRVMLMIRPSDQNALDQLLKKGKASGAYLCRLDVDASNNKVGIELSVTLIPNRRYKFSFYYMNSAPDKTGRYTLCSQKGSVYLNSGGNWQGPITVPFANSTTWKKYELEFNAHPDHSDYALYFRNHLAASSSIYLDDISIQEITSSIIRPNYVKLLPSIIKRFGSIEIHELDWTMLPKWWPVILEFRKEKLVDGGLESWIGKYPSHDLSDWTEYREGNSTVNQELYPRLIFLQARII